MTFVPTFLRPVSVWGRQSGYSRVLILSLVMLSLPWLVMQFTSEMQWALGDFLLFGLMLISAGSLFVWLNRRFPARRLWLMGAVLLLFVYCWAELAVGIFFHVGS